jgi:photosystem II stability/assembly factor-like uncharacterized protein
MRKKALLSTVLAIVLLTFNLFAQKGKNELKKDTLVNEKVLSGLKFRNIGPALMSGRVSDIAIDPENESIWYVTMGSSGVWKTENAGVTWTPIFDHEKSFSIGCVTIDPSNHYVIWIGTGENNGGRHISYGDGVYRSKDGGKNWENMGLSKSEHIAKIIVHPNDPNTVWVAAQGPLWSKGGERGLYKSIDGGKTWKKTLGDDEWVGVTDIVIDPRDPNRLYAATWQRQRTVAAYLGGGPGSGIYSSEDGGETWQKLKNGLPDSEMGKIGLAISPMQPDVLYAAIELDRRKGGFYRSADRGQSWKKMSNAISGGTGPLYYQELWASPHQFDRVYFADNWMQVTDDGGKTMRRWKNDHKHVDNHAMAFKKNDPDYLLVGCDGGVYESFDLEENWRFMANLPTLQFYKLAVDDTEPFYFIYGGTQDNNSLGGPSRTDSRHGISNADWFVTLGGDGHQSAIEPGNPNIFYAEWQQGNIYRIDRATGEKVYIKPQPKADEPRERYNWDSPILVSPHDPKQIFFASQRVWKSDNRGDSWTAISPDLTHNKERIKQEIMDNYWSFDSPWDIDAMSDYSTITSLAESPIQAGVIYAGTDDGLIQATSNGGETWRKIEVGSLPGCPSTAFVNDIKADLYDANTVYAVLDNHKFGDYDPYLYKSTDQGKSWKSMLGNLKQKGMLWRIVQDHISPNLFFLASEFGIYVSLDAGNNWIKMEGGLPTISFRDLAIQKRENDLVAASFGRGFFVLDDYSALREISEQSLEQEAILFPSRKAWWYLPTEALGSSDKGIQGASYYTAPNPAFGATFTYYLKDSYKSKEEQRQKKEGKLEKKKEPISFPGWDELQDERIEYKPEVWVLVKDGEGNVVRKVEGSTKKGINRVSWDLRYPHKDALTLDEKEYPKGKVPSGYLCSPGKYTAQLYKQIEGQLSPISESIELEVVPMNENYLESMSKADVAKFWRELERLDKEITATDRSIKDGEKRVVAMQNAITISNADFGTLYSQLEELRLAFVSLNYELSGNPAKNEVGALSQARVWERYNVAVMGVSESTYGPTPLHLENVEIALQLHQKMKKKLLVLLDEKVPAMEEALEEAGAPWIQGQPLPKD